MKRKKAVLDELARIRALLALVDERTYASDTYDNKPAETMALLRSAQRHVGAAGDIINRVK